MKFAQLSCRQLTACLLGKARSGAGGHLWLLRLMRIAPAVVGTTHEPRYKCKSQDTSQLSFQPSSSRTTRASSLLNPFPSPSTEYTLFLHMKELPVQQIWCRRPVHIHQREYVFS